MVESNLQAEHQDERGGQCQAEEEEDKRTNDRIEDKFSEIFHEFRDDVQANARVKFPRQLDAQQKINTISLKERERERGGGGIVTQTQF